METQVLPVSEDSVALAACLLQQGQVVAIPTETVYGLAANAMNGVAVQRIFKAKARPQDNPLIAHVHSFAQMNRVAREVSPKAEKLAQAFWPGPLTLVLPRGRGVADEVCAGLDTVGVRMPSHPAALAVIKAAGFPLAAPSANLSGSPSPTKAEHVLADMQGRIPLILDGGACTVGVESTVLALVNGPLVLRPGAVTLEMIRDVLGVSVGAADAITHPLREDEHPASPGMKYRHYAPKAEITILCGSFKKFAAYIARHVAPGVFALCFEGEQHDLPVPAVVYGRKRDDVSQALALFDALRMLDIKGAVTVYARCPSTDGVGLAVYNRLLRAAAFRVKTI